MSQPKPARFQSIQHEQDARQGNEPCQALPQTWRGPKSSHRQSPRG